MDDRLEQFQKEKLGRQEKEPYATPQLTIHGDMARITKDIRTTGSDGFAGSVIDR